MKAAQNNVQTLVKVPEMALLSLVAAKLKGRIFFPEKVESVRKHLDSIKKFSF
jgi:hypothetical protein